MIGIRKGHACVPEREADLRTAGAILAAAGDRGIGRQDHDARIRQRRQPAAGWNLHDLTIEIVRHARRVVAGRAFRRDAELGRALPVIERRRVIDHLRAGVVELGNELHIAGGAAAVDAVPFDVTLPVVGIEQHGR